MNVEVSECLSSDARSRVADFYKRYGGIIFARARRMLRNDAEAEDATQEIFVRVLRHCGKKPDDAQVLPWIHRICTNYCLNVIRQRRSPALELAGYDGFSDDMEEQVANRDLAETILLQANEKTATVAKMYYLEGDKQLRVAQRLNISRRTVNTRLQQFVTFARKISGMGVGAM